VTILLPQTTEAVPVEAPPQVAEAPLAAVPATVLVVEDDELVRTQVVFAIETLGYKVIAVASPPAALVQLSSAAPIDLLFTDIVMPGGMNGRELATAARAMRPGLRVLFTSGYADAVPAPDDQLGGNARVLAKPYRHSDLALALREALSGKIAPADKRASVG
jgi:CheY-like chemotaxis protein